MASQTNLTQDQIAAIERYGDEIKQLKDFQTGVRKRPSVYIGSLQNKGLQSMIKEIYQNAVDQLTDPTSPCDWIGFSYNENTLEVSVEDTGKGFPRDKVITIMTTMHTSKNFEKVKGRYSSGENGLGASITCALSLSFVIESYKYDGSAFRMSFERGYPTTKTPVDIPNKQKKQGTKITFIPDEEIMGEMNLSWQHVYKFVKLILSFTPIGSNVDFSAIDKQGVVHKEKIVNKDGIITDIIMKSNHPIVKPIICFADDGYRKVETAFTFDAGDKDGPDPIEDVTSFANWSPTMGGNHVDGVIAGICKFFTQYMNNIFLAGTQQKNKKNPLKVVASDIKTGLKVIINAAHLEPQYSAQAKEVLSNPDMLDFATNTVMQGLQEWAKNNPNDLLKLCKYFKDIAELRLKQNSEKVKIVNKYQSNSITGYPAKYVKPTKYRKEFMIVEGDSAISSATDGRDTSSQGVYPIRGKVLNVFRASRSAVLANEELQGIIKIITGQDASKFDRKFDPIKDVEWEKVIIMADADVDGYHIASLLLRFFLLYMPQLIEAGKIYKAVPPLYSIPRKGGEEYFTRNIDFVKYIQKLYLSNNKVEPVKGKGQLTGKDATLFFMNNEDYAYWLERLANTYSVEPKLMEMALFHHIKGDKIADIQKDLKKMYRFMDVKKVKDTTMFSGTIKESNFLFMNDQMIKDSEEMIKIMNKNKDWYYKINGEVGTIYDVMKGFEKTQPTHLQRYKGLGEMDADQLAESTILPDVTVPIKIDNNKTKNVTGNRTLIRYTIEDAKEEIELIRKYESDYSQLFKFVGNVSRQDLID